MKKTLCLLLSLALVCTLFCACVKESPEPVFTPPTVAPEHREKTGEMEYMGLMFALYNDYTCELLGLSETANHDSELVIPETCEKHTLVRICDSAFAESSFTSVTIPDTVTDIGSYAFQKCEIRSIVLPASLKTLGTEAFDNCLNLEKVVFQSGVETIPTAAFYGCEKIRELVLPEGVKIICEEAFASLKNLEKLSLPESLEEIGDYAFWGSGTANLTVTIPAGVKKIGTDAFAATSATVKNAGETP